MGMWVDCYVVENEKGEYIQHFGNETHANQYADWLTLNGPEYIMNIRHTIVYIKG